MTERLPAFQPGGHGAEGLAAVGDGVFLLLRDFGEGAAGVGVRQEDGVVAEAAGAVLLARDTAFADALEEVRLPVR